MNRPGYPVQRHLDQAGGAEANAANCVGGLLAELYRDPWAWDPSEYADDPGRFGAMAEWHFALASYLKMAWHSRVLAAVEMWNYAKPEEGCTCTTKLMPVTKINCDCPVHREPDIDLEPL